MELYVLKNCRRPLALFQSFDEYPGNLSTNRQKGMKIQKKTRHTLPVLKKHLVNSKAFTVNELRSFIFK
jgi:hypothetical protein